MDDIPAIESGPQDQEGHDLHHAEHIGLRWSVITANSDEISVEETEGGDRYDVLIHRSGEAHIIEGKIGTTQHVGQLERYIGSMHRRHGRKPALTVVDDGSQYRHARLPSFDALRRRVTSLTFATWTEVAQVCRSIAQKRRNATTDPIGTVVAGELAIHLKENDMTIETPPEIYLRDVSSPDSVELYFRHRVYKCQSSFFKSARRNLYFAPYFTRKMADRISEENLVPIGEGISFVSRVTLVQVTETRDVLNLLKDNGHENAAVVANIIRRKHRAKEVLIILLGEPRLMFVSPVTKAKLAKKLPFGKGAMGSRSCTFDDLLSASQ